jgi:hypothetical protein
MRTHIRGTYMICVYHRDLGAFDCSRQASEMFHASQSALKDATDYVASFAPRFAWYVIYRYAFIRLTRTIVCGK